MVAHYMSDKQFKLIYETAAQNLAAWKRSGVVKTLKCYSAEDDDVCETCRQHDGNIVKIEEAVIGVYIPKFDNCSSNQCRCYFRPWDISIE
jgi:hypothetical protein